MKLTGKHLAGMTFLLLFFLACPTSGNAAPEWVRQFEGGQEYRLGNGLKVILFSDESKPVATVNITYLVGSRHEGYGERGMAHMLEHMMFKGSLLHPDIPAELAKHGGQANGTTWYDRTNYYEVLPEGDEHLAWALNLEADRMVNSALRGEDLAKEMTVVRNEWEAGENRPLRVLRQRIFSTAYLWHNYGQDTIGARSDLENVSVERLKTFYRYYYQPDNAVLVITGNFKPERALTLVDASFSGIEAPKRTREETYTLEPAQDGERQVVLRRVGDVPALGLAYHIPAAAHPDNAALCVLAQILDDQPSGRLYKELVQTGLVATLGASASRLHDPGLFEIYMTGGKTPLLLREKTQAALNALAKTAPTKVEVERAKKNLTNELTALMRSPEKFGIQLSESIGSGDWRLFFLYRDQVAAVTPQDVKRVAGLYLVTDNRTSGEFQPVVQAAKVEIPTLGDLMPQLERLKEGATMKAGETLDLTAEKLQERVQTQAMLPERKISVLQKATKDDLVSISLKLHLGDERSLYGQGKKNVALAKLLMRGTQKHSEAEISDLLARWQAELKIQGGKDYIAVDLQVPRENMGSAMALVGEMLRQPKLDKKEWGLLKEQWLSQLESRRNDPQTLAFQALGKRSATKDPQAVGYVMSIEEEMAALKDLTAQQLAEFHQRFYGASVMEASAVGAVTPMEMKTLLADAFAEWASQVKPKAVLEGYRPITPEKVSITTPDKENAVLIGGQAWQLKRSSPDYPVLLLANEILGGGFLNSRLALRVRQQEGLSYSVGSQVQGGSLTDNGSFLFYAICAPQNVARLEQVVQEELVRIATEGVSAAEVAEAKVGMLKSLRLQRAQEPALAKIMLDQLYTGRSFLDTAEQEKRLQEISAEEVSAVLQRYLKPEQLVVIRAGDWKRQ